MMDNEELSRVAKERAVGLGLCEEWTMCWGNPDRQGLLDKYLHGIDFCIKHDYPGAGFLKENFGLDLLHRNQIFVDENVHLRNLQGMVVLNGGCSGVLLFDGLSVCDLYVLNDSDVTVDCGHLSKVFINVYGHGKVDVTQRDAASVYVYLHGDDCRVSAKGDVLTRISGK